MIDVIVKLKTSAWQKFIFNFFLLLLVFVADHFNTRDFTRHNFEVQIDVK